MGIEEEEVQGERIENIFNKVIVENFQNLEKERAIQGKEASPDNTRKEPH
jgi:hypothetical protein